MIYTLTNLSTGEQVEWHAGEGELIDAVGHWFALSGNFHRDRSTRVPIYRLQWALRHGRATGELEDELGVRADPA